MQASACPPVRVENVRTKVYKKIYKYYKTILIKFSKTFPRKLFPNYNKSKERGRCKGVHFIRGEKKLRESVFPLCI